jgi:hypothetical protein
MRTRVIAVLVALVSVATFAYAQAGGGQRAQSGTTVETKGVASRGAAAQDPNIKTPKGVNKAGAQKPAPPNKGGRQPATRGVAVCEVDVDNWTGYWIDIYVDGDFSGTVSAWGDGYTYAIAGGTRLYGKAVLDNGGDIHWGPQTVNCPPNGVFTWKLTY